MVHDGAKDVFVYGAAITACETDGLWSMAMHLLDGALLEEAICTREVTSIYQPFGFAKECSKLPCGPTEYAATRQSAHAIKDSRISSN